MEAFDKKGPRFLLAGNGPYANKGCEAIVRGSVELITKRFPEASFVLSSFGASVQSEARTEIDSRIEHRPHVDPTPPRFPSARWWRSVVLGQRDNRTDRPFAVQVDSMAECDCALLLGGDNYSLDYGRPTRFVAMNEALLETGKPVVLWGGSVGPFVTDPEFEHQMAEHLRRLALVLAREEETVSYLASIGVTDNVRLVADPAFCMMPREPRLQDDLASFVEQRPIGLNLSALAGLYWPRGEQDWFEVARECAKSLVKSLGPLLLVPHVTIKTSCDNDHAFLKRVRDSLPELQNSLRVLPPSLSAAEYKWIISRLAAFAGARMHAAVAALSSAVPTVSIGYSMKYRGINKLIFGHEDWLLPIEQFSADALQTKMLAVVEQSERVSAHLRHVIPRVVEMSEAAAGHLATVLES
jgi:colanic acid/amylovoran biosynthesis protein